MDSGHGEVTENIEDDRLSSLPDDLIHKILSFLDIKHAVQTSVLSSRWKFIWTSMSHLSFSSAGFSTLSDFSKFVSRVLSGRNNQVEVSSVNLTAAHRLLDYAFVKRLLDYAFSHNVQLLNIFCYWLEWIEFWPTWKLPTLTTLNLNCVKLVDYNGDECTCFFSNCTNLKNLTLGNCIMKDRGDRLNICHPGLSSLTLEYGYAGVNVITPQLKNLTIIDWPNIHLISTPNLVSFHYKYKDGDDSYDFPLELSTDLFHLEKVDICIQCSFEDEAYTHKVVCMLQQIRSVKCLALNLELVEHLCSFVELILHQPSPFANLKSLKIYPADVISDLEEQKQPKITMFPEVKRFLLDGSPGATFTMVSHEEARALQNVAFALKDMSRLQVELDKWAENSKATTTHMVTVHEQFGKGVTHIDSYWDGLEKHLKRVYTDTSNIISMLQMIEVSMTELPASHRDKLQARFSRLGAEAKTVMASMMDHMKIQCEKTLL